MADDKTASDTASQTQPTATQPTKVVSITPASVSTGNDKSTQQTGPVESTPPVQEPPAPLSVAQRMDQILREDFARVEKLTGSYYNFIGKCAKCGWQTMQMVESDAVELVTKHAFSHWKDVAHKL